MKRFTRTFTVKRHTQFTVIEDRPNRVITVMRWDADSKTGPTEIARFPYFGVNSGGRKTMPEELRDGYAMACDAAVNFARKAASDETTQRASDTLDKLFERKKDQT